MSGRFVRASKFRHVHGVAAKKQDCYNNVKPLCTGDGNYIAASTKFFAFAMSGGGGPLVVHPLSRDKDKETRLNANPPKINVHKQKIVDFDFSPFMDNMVATASEDCYVKITVIPETGLEDNITDSNATLEGHTKKLSLLKFHPTANNVLGSVGYDKAVKIWDIERQAEICNREFPDFIDCLEWNQNGSLLATTCKDKNVYLYDPRGGEGQSTVGFAGAKGMKCAWLKAKDLPNEHLLVVGFSKTSARQFRVYDPKKFSEPIDTFDIDSTAGILYPFSDVDTSVFFLAGKGDGNIRYYEYTSEPPYAHFLSEFRSNEPQKGVCFLPKRACDTTTCEIAVALRLMRDYVQPVSFQVPRKSDMFQSDIYPDAYAGIPSITASEWFEGKDADPKKMSMKPGSQEAPTQKMEFKAKKSPDDLSKELAAANARIKQLEEELAKLKSK